MRFIEIDRDSWRFVETERLVEIHGDLLRFVETGGFVGFVEFVEFAQGGDSLRLSRDSWR